MNLKEEVLKLKQIKSGWYNGEGVEFNKNGLFWLSLNIDKIFKGIIHPTIISPMINGNVMFEWSFNNFEISTEFNVISKTLEYSDVNLKTRFGTNKEFKVKTTRDIKIINRFLYNLFKNLL